MFKHTGIIRRIDDIGRIIIPKEVRRKFRICDGDPIEIGEDGDAIALRKYSIIEFWSEYTQKILYSFSKTTSLPVVLCNRNSVLASYGT
ncbi:MAG: stage V sporulation protein T, partial [Lachnospiraceae bacterium]|nr:stage V sporulation protein T [Lachnospiraceae bacterium]